MKIKYLFWRKNIFGELRRAFLGIKNEDITWKGLTKDHALEWGEANKNPGYWSCLFDKIYSQEEKKNILKLSNSLNDLKIWSTNNPKRGDRPKISRRIWGKTQEDIIESWYLKNFILSKKIISDFISRKKISSGDVYKFYNLIETRLNELNQIQNLNYSDIFSWAKNNNNIFNALKLNTTWFVENNLKIEIEKHLKDKSYIILYNTYGNEDLFYTTIINSNEFLDNNFFEKIKESKNNSGFLKDIEFRNGKIDNNFLFTESLDNPNNNNNNDNDERIKIYLDLVNHQVEEQISKLAIEDGYQRDINIIQASEIKKGPIEKKNRKGSDLSNKYKYQRNPSVSAIALQNANYRCELDSNHKTFKQSNLRNYVEGHHVIPMHAQDEFEYSIDVPENIVALCPNCHRETHLSENKEKLKIVNKLFKIIKQRNLSDRKIHINLEKILKYYQL
jgi:hypothetical protein